MPKLTLIHGEERLAGSDFWGIGLLPRQHYPEKTIRRLKATFEQRGSDLWEWWQSEHEDYLATGNEEYRRRRER